MAEPTQSTPHARLADFDRIPNVPFWSLHGHALGTDVWVPKTATAASSLPLIIHWHGGGMVGGSRENTDWWAGYLIEFAAASNAIIVAPDYPLTPESQSPDILEGVRQAMSWFTSESGLQQTLTNHFASRNLKLDTEKLFVTSESAGGWCAFWAGLEFPDKIRALLLRNPMIDTGNEWFMQSQIDNPNLRGIAKQFRGLPKSIIVNHIAELKPGQVRLTGGVDPPIAGISLFNGMVPAMLGLDKPETFPLKRFESGQDVRLPRRIWVVHPADDSVIPVAQSLRLEELIRSEVNGTEIKVDTPPGEHGGDSAWTINDAPMPCPERLAWLREVWLK